MALSGSTKVKLETLVFEFTITATPLTDKDIFGWETSLNASYLKNKIIDLAGSDFIVGENYTSIGGGPIQIKKVGYPIGSFYLYEWANFNDQAPTCININLMEV